MDLVIAVSPPLISHGMAKREEHADNTMFEVILKQYYF